MLALQDRHKYALLSLPHLHAAVSGGHMILAEEGYALTAAHPVSDIEGWRPTFGRHRFKALTESSRYLIVYARSHNPAILDHENKALERRLHRFHLGLLLACPFIAYEESVFLEGACQNGRTDIRGHTTYERVVRINGGPAPYVREFHLRFALSLGRSTRRLQRHGAGRRFGRVLRAFRAGLHTADLDVRIHQFVRCVEAFVGSWRKEEFAARVSLFASSVSEVDLRQMYQIRSAVEHFGGWKAAIPIAGDAAKECVLVERAVQVQAIAQSVLSRYVDNPALWPHFLDEGTVKRYLNIPETDRAAMWGAQLDVGAITKGLDLKKLRNDLDRDE